MADLSLEDIATQFEEALGQTTGTTIAPGTIAPVGTELGEGRRKLSWPEIVQRIRDDVGITQTETLPSVPGGVPASAFYRAGAQTGFLPSGLNVFKQSPFGSFEGRMAVAAGQQPDGTPEATQEAIESAAQGQQQVISGRARPLAESFNPVTSNDWTEGPGSQALAGVPFSSIAGGVSGLIMGLFGGTPYNDFTHMLGRDSGGTSTNANFTHVHDGTTLYMNETLWRDWDNLSKTQKDFLAAGQLKMFEDKENVWRATDGTRNDKTKQMNPIENLLTTQMFGGPTDRELRDYEKYVGNYAGDWRDSYGAIGSDYKDDDSFVGRSITGEDKGVLQDKSPVPSNWPTQQEVIAVHEMETSPEQAAAAESIDETQSTHSMPDPEDWYQFQEGGPIPAMPQPQGGAPGEDVVNLGVINEQAAPPQQGGQASVKDDVPRKADEGDYILPYETVLLVGLKQLNRYAREAIKLAMKNNINLAGTDLDPTDDVPIKVSNYEYHIPKTLVPFFGGGKKYLDKIRNEGLSLRKRLEEEKQPSAEQQQPQPSAEPTPPQMAPAAPPQAGPPQMPMMQKGGFVISPQEKQQKLPTTEAILESDVSDTSTQAAAYNQVKALERSRNQQQQPPMVDPTGKIIPQGFAAPQGYDAGGTIIDPEDPPIPGRKPEIEDRDYFKLAKKRMEMFNRLEPAKKLAMVAMLEGRGEGRQGMQAIMNVVMNRVNSNSSEFYDSTIQGSPVEQVLMKPLAFTALSALNKNHPYNNPKSRQYNPEKYSREVDNLATSFDKIREGDKNWKEAYEDARKALSGQLPDITKGALFYYNPEKQGMPRHLREKSFITAVGKHHFHNSGGFVHKVLDTAA